MKLTPEKIMFDMYAGLLVLHAYNLLNCIELSKRVEGMKQEKLYGRKKKK